MGANDFIRKEVLLTEVEARIYNALRAGSKKDRTVFNLTPATTFNAITCELTIGGTIISLRPHESLVFKVLCMHMDEQVGKEEIAKAVWGEYDRDKDAYIDRHIMRLRRFLSGEPELSIVTYYGAGYCLTYRKKCATQETKVE